MASLWRALALVWLGGVASPALMDDVEPFNVVIEAPSTPAGSIAGSEMAAGISPSGENDDRIVVTPPVREAR